MKNLFKLSAVLAVVVLTLSGCNCFKKMAKNQDDVKLTCTPEVLVLNNGKVDADIAVTFPEKYFNAKAVLKVTPVIVFEGGEVAGTTQYFQGSKVDDNYTVIDKKMGGNYTMHVSFPYDERMACSELQLRAEIKCPKGKCKEFTLVNLNNGAIPTKEEAAVLAAGGAEADALKRAFGLTVAQGVNTLQRDLNFASAMQDMESGYKNVITEVTKADYKYAINSSRLAKKAKTSEDLTAFQQKAAEQKDNDRIKQNIYVNGYASPDGPEKFNDKLSAARSESGKKAAEELLKEIGLSLDAASYGEDWEGFKELVAASNIEDKALILSVLESYTSSSEREEQIKNMSNVFTALKKEILPQLRRAQLVNSSDITGKTDDEMAALVRAGKFAELDEKELLHIASTGKLTAAEKIATLEVAAREYKSAAAYNNLGVAYAEVGEGAKAAEAFANAVKAGANASAINNNLALVNLMNGNTEAAKAYTANASKEAKALAAAAEGNYAQAQSQLEGYNAAIAATMNADYTAAKQFIANDVTAEADYLRAVIATKQGDMATATAELKSAIAKDASMAERAKKDVNLRKYIGTEIVL
jgi:outer membrane protein OmpA-like peptidoglycan-associated protein/Flp pilus assembly protein TadD